MNANQRFLVTLFLGVFGIHRFLDHKYGTGALWLVTGGVLWAGWAWDCAWLGRPCSTCVAQAYDVTRPVPDGGLGGSLW